MSILITGGAGYIGSHAAHALCDLGEDVVVLDNLKTGNRAFVPATAEFVEGDAGDYSLVAGMLESYGIETVLHFAGSILPNESISHPILYYQNNVAVSRNLIAACVEKRVRNFIFSSSAAVYGPPAANPVDENAATFPLSPYGRSKLMVEWMLEDAARAHDLKYVVLRYFNVAGVDPNGRAGQPEGQVVHLIKTAALAALGRRDRLDIYGTDYPTRDGTAIRDYIHVSDLAGAHLLAVEYLRKDRPSAIFNCGYGRGATVREVISAFEKVTGHPIAVRPSARRAGDAAEVVADSSRVRSAFGWKPRFDSLDTIVRSALDWERRQ